MSPEKQEEFDTMKRQLDMLMQVLDVNFIENVKRRCVEPRLNTLNLTAVVSKIGDGDTSGVLQAVNEGGSGIYSVATEYDGTITVRDAEGTSYKLGYYTP